MANMLILKAPSTTTTIAKFADTADPDETAHNKPSHLDLQSLPSRLLIFHIIQFILKVFHNFAGVILSSTFLALYGLRLLFSQIALSYDRFSDSVGNRKTNINSGIISPPTLRKTSRLVII